MLDSAEGETQCKIRVLTSGPVIKPKCVELVACDREGPQTNRRQPVESTFSAVQSTFSAVERPFLAFQKTFSAHPVFAPFWCQFAARDFSGLCCSFLAWQWGNQRLVRQICMSCIDGCLLDQYMHTSNKQFPSPAPWLTLASFCRRSSRSTLKLGKLGLQPLPATFQWEFRAKHDPTKLKQKNAFSQKMYFTTSAIY